MPSSMTSPSQPSEQQVRRQGPRLWLVLASLTLVMGMFGIYVVSAVKTNAEKHLIAHLEQILEGTSMMVANSYETLVQSAFTMQRNGSMREKAQQVREAWAKGVQTENEKQAFIALARDLSRYPQNYGFVLSDQKGEILFSSLTHIDVKPSDFIFEGRGDLGFGVRISQPLLLPSQAVDSAGDLVLALRFPLPLDSAASSGAPALEMWQIYDARKIFQRLLLPGRTGTSGEIYAFNRQGGMISDSRFNEHLYHIGLLERGQEASMRLHLRDPQVDLTQTRVENLFDPLWPLTKMAQAATQGRSGTDIRAYRDYRGVPVVGAWRWFEQYGFGIAHEIDEKEAFFDLRMLIQIVSLLLGLLLATTLISGFMSWRMRQADELRLRSQQRLASLQNEMAHYSRMATMGEMATGLAHEINQPLVAISNYARSLLLEADRNDEIDPQHLHSRLLRIESSALLAGDIIQRLRQFVSPGVGQSAYLNIEKCIDDALSLLQGELERSGAEVKVSLLKPLPPVSGDGVQLQQVILNLLRNSIEAMQKKKGGQSPLLSITVKAEEREGAALTIAIRDRGPGFDPLIKARMFEPFNSSQASGMGMGLAISRTIMEKHGGKIELQEDGPEGVCFLLTLPSAAVWETGGSKEKRGAPVDSLASGH